MHLALADQYPTGSVGNCDFFTGASLGQVEEIGPDGPVLRPERVILTDRFLDFDGQVCIGERTARHLARAFDMVDGWRVARIVADNESLRAELVQLSTEVAESRRETQFLRDLEVAGPQTRYVAVDGTEHASRRAALEQTAAALNVKPSVITDAIPAKEPV